MRDAPSIPTQKPRLKRGSRPTPLNRLVAVALLLLVVGAFAGNRLQSASAEGATLTVCDVDCDYTTISAAVAASFPGDTVSVGAGTFVAKDIRLNKAGLTLEGAGQASTTLNGAGAASATVWVDADNVTVRNLTLTGGTNAVRFDQPGLTISGTLIEDVTIADNSSYALNVNAGIPGGTTVDGLTLRRATIARNSTGLRTGSTAIGKNILIENSTFIDQNLALHQNTAPSGGTTGGGYIDGLTVKGSSFTATSSRSQGLYGEELKNVLIENNTFSGPYRGLSVSNNYNIATQQSGNITVKGNTFTDLKFAPILISSPEQLDLPVSIEGNTFNLDLSVTDPGARWGQAVEVALKAGFEHGAVSITGNTINVTRSNIDTSVGAQKAYGIVLRGDYDGVTISGNTIDGGDVFATAGAATPTSAGIYVDPKYINSSSIAFGTPLAASTLDIANNLISGFLESVAFYNSVDAVYGGLPTGHAVTIEDNSFAGYGVNSGTSAVDATRNWWGQASGPSAQASASVITAPWIVSYTPDPAKATDPGFWPTAATYEAAVTTIAPASEEPQTFAVTAPSLGSPAITIPALETETAFTVSVTETINPVGAEDTPFRVGSGTFIDISVTGVAGPFTICLDSTGPDQRLYHYNGTVWEDVTSAGYPTGGRICGEVATLSPFFVATLEPTTTTTQVSDASISFGESVDDDATVTGAIDNGEGGFIDPTGTVQFYYCYDAETAPTTCDVETGTVIGSAVTLDGGDNPADGIATATLSGFTPSAPGYYLFHAVYSGDAYYAGSADDGTNEAVTVGKAKITITADDDSVEYGEAAPGSYTYTATGFISPDSSSSLPSGWVAPTCALDGTYAVTDNAGTTYAIKCSGAAADYYDIEYVDGTLTVTKAPLTVTANNETVTYGDSIIPAYDYTVVEAGLKNTDTSAVVSGVSCTSDFTSSTSVAASPLAVVCSGGTATNYEITHVDGDLTINKASITVTADDVTVTYGDAEPTYEITVTGLLNGADESVITGLTCDSSYTTTTGVASSPLTITCSGGTATDYTITLYNPGSLTINKATLTIDADDKSVTYGGVAPTYTFTPSGFKNGETAATAAGWSNPTCTSAYTATTPVADSPLTISCTGGAADNYEFDYADGELTINRATLTVTPDDQTITYGDPAPEYTFTVTGFQNEEDETTATGYLAPTCSAASVFSTSTITCSGGDADNYTFTYNTATLTVTPYEVSPADAWYTGQLLYYTKSTTDTAVQVTLTASISANFTCTEGGPSVASGFVTFLDATTGKEYAKNVPIALVDGNCNEGIATAFATLTAGSNYVEAYVIAIKLSGSLTGGNYGTDTAYQLNAEPETATVTVSTPQPTGLGFFGSGELAFLPNVSATDLGTEGTLTSAMTTGDVVKFSFGFTYTTGKKPTLKGQVTLIIPGPDGSFYHIKSNSITSATSSLGNTGTVFAKANVTRVNADLTTTSIEGGASLRLDVTDTGELAGFTIQSTKTSALLYSNWWTKPARAWLTKQQIVAPTTPAGFISVN